MKYKYAYCLLTTSIAAMLSSTLLAQASSIQVIAPSKTKFQIIGTIKKTSPKPMVKETSEKMSKASEPEMKAKAVAAKTVTPEMPVMAKKPQAPAMPQMRTGEAELPIVQVNETKSSE